ncbi:c-type heme family protein [Roseateles chitinivorans]|uniref:Tll0287-like domain-containing protein n=1 Tax=Roseateles chitinivorans TaxID=2917965 RepID=UPI003D673B88
MSRIPTAAGRSGTRPVPGATPAARFRHRLRSMSLLVKFNAIFLAVFLVGLAGTAVLARHWLQASAQEQVTDRARLLMRSAGAVSTYTADHIRPLLEDHLRERFVPEAVPAFSAHEVLATLSKAYEDYGYKAAMLNPTNPRNRAVSWEEDVISQFARRPALTEFIGRRETPGGEALYIARPIRITNAACLGCHASPQTAPATLVARYGPSNGFGWRLDETLGAEVVTVPMTLPLKQASQTFWLVMGALTATFLVMGAALNLMLWSLVIRPVTGLARIADRVSLGEDAPAFEVRPGDQIGVLAASFGRMRRSLDQAMAMLESGT